MTTCSFLLCVCIWVLGFYTLEALGVLMGSLEFCSPNYGLVIMLLSLFVDAIVELHAIDEKKCFMTFSLESASGFICNEYVLKAYFIQYN